MHIYADRFKFRIITDSGIDWTLFTISACYYAMVNYTQRPSIRIHRESLILEQEQVSGPLTLESKFEGKIRRVESPYSHHLYRKYPSAEVIGTDLSPIQPSW